MHNYLLIKTMAPLKPEKLLDFNQNSTLPFLIKNFQICPVSYYCQGLLVNLFINTLQFIMRGKMSLSMHALSTSLAQFQAFKTYMMWNQFTLDTLITWLLFLTSTSFKFLLHISFYCSTSMTTTESHRFDLQIVLMGSDIAKETVRKQREAGNQYEKNNKRRKAEWKEHRILV